MVMHHPNWDQEAMHTGRAVSSVAKSMIKALTRHYAGNAK